MVATLDSLPALHDLPSAQAFSWQACRLFGVPVRVHGEQAERGLAAAGLGCASRRPPLLPRAAPARHRHQR